MRLVVLTHVYPLNPRAPADIPGNFLPPFIHALCARGAQVSVLAPERSGEKVQDPGAPVTWFEWWGDRRNLGRFNPLNPLDALRLASLYRRGVSELQALVRRRHADAVLACWAVPSGAIAARAGRALKAPCAVWSLGSDVHTSARNPVLRPLVVGALKQAALRYASSHVLAGEVEKLSGLPCAFLATARALPDAAPAPLPRGRVNFLYAGRLEPVKGVDILIEALARVRAAGGAVHLYIAGHGSQEAALRAQVAARGLADDVTFLGFLSEAPLASYLRAVDAVVIPSRAEALPVIFTEAARLGTPAVVTDVGDLGPLARQYGTAIVVEPEKVEALARGLLALARDDRDALRRGMPALVANFDNGASADKLLSDLAGVLSTRGTSLRHG